MGGDTLPQMGACGGFLLSPHALPLPPAHHSHGNEDKLMERHPLWYPPAPALLPATHQHPHPSPPSQDPGGTPPCSGLAPWEMGLLQVLMSSGAAPTLPWLSWG